MGKLSDLIKEKELKLREMAIAYSKEFEEYKKLRKRYIYEEDNTGLYIGNFYRQHCSGNREFYFYIDTIDNIDEDELILVFEGKTASVSYDSHNNKSVTYHEGKCFLDQTTLVKSLPITEEEFNGIFPVSAPHPGQESNK